MITDVELDRVRDLLADQRPVNLSSVPDGMAGYVVADLARAASGGRIMFVARDGQRLAEIVRGIRFFAPDLDILEFPAWDCLPYDRVSPYPGIVAARMATLARLADPPDGGQVLLTTVNAAIQRVPQGDFVRRGTISASAGGQLPMADLLRWLDRNGFSRSTTVREAGEYAVRGGILDLFAAGADQPLRFDFFGDTLESIRTFDAETQRTTGTRPRLDLVPVSEMDLTAESIARFRTGYIAEFGTADRDDLLYSAISEGRRYVGMDHWLPLFADRLETIFDHFEDAPVVLDNLVDEALSERFDEIADHYQARASALTNATKGGGPPYRPLAPERLYVTADEWSARLSGRSAARITPFAQPPSAATVNIDARDGRNFATERQTEDVNVFDAVVGHIRQRREAGLTVVIACWSDGSRDRMQHVLADHGLNGLRVVETWPQAGALDPGLTGLTVLGLEKGFEARSFAVIGEQDILGDRLVRPRAKRRPANYLSDVSSLAAGDIVVHIDHGIGRFTGLKTIEAAGAPHDCVEIGYAGGDRVYLPVENIDLLSCYGSADVEVALDRLGGVAWQSRKAQLKKRIREMADALIKVAATRAMKNAPVLMPPDGLGDEFAARFPFEETDDQATAIEDVTADLGAGKPMDRLICGDVGFGKTEVALRAAFATVMSGKQVAIVVPTTLLARQHLATFTDRFAGFPVRVAHASRLVGARELTAVKAGLADGTIDIVVGTHALLGKSVSFADLGLLVVDEEQHFGVRHKERLKEMRSDIHVLSLSATPIPRTLQLALTGVRELSLITTPPVDRMAVRTFVSPLDPLVVRETLLRERYRGGQSFYVCPRVGDLAERGEFLSETVPEVKVGVAHGQMPASGLEDVMSAFYDRAYDVLLSTSIVESGLDIPTANTLIVHRADMFGLAQLYQLRGRVGRSKQRAYALFTLPIDRTLTTAAEQRLKVLQSLDTLGAGFQLASHDMDIRGAGNLLGEEQSGHIREVGYELYQQMLEEAIASLKHGGADADDGRWSPQITVGMAVMIPESYVSDLQLRMGLYKRLADLDEQMSIDAFAAEMIDRFGPLPEEVEHLLEIVAIKVLCRRANVDKVEVGPKGAVVSFRDNRFADPAALIDWLGQQGSLARIRPDESIVLLRQWRDLGGRLKGTRTTIGELARLAESGGQAAA